MKKKLKAFFVRLGDLLEDVAVYVFTVIGVLGSNLIFLLNQPGKIKIEIETGRIILACIAGFTLLKKQEELKPDEEGKIEKAKEGRRNRLRDRLINALLSGMGWTVAINGLIKLGGL